MKLQQYNFIFLVVFLSLSLFSSEEGKASKSVAKNPPVSKGNSLREVVIVPDDDEEGSEREDSPPTNKSLAAPKDLDNETIKDSSEEAEEEISEIEEEDDYKEYKDPIAPFNKFVFGFNKVTDGLILKPLTLTYKYIVPSFMRTGVHNVLGNLKEPLNFFNALLQGEGQKAGHSLARFIMNTLFGLAGIFDVASESGIKEQPNDFGITLAKWGFGEGFYLVLPIFGPSNFRDAIGKVGDFFMDPFTYYVYQTDRRYLGYIRFGATAIDTRLNLLDITDSLDRSSDPYNSYRVTFTDNRRYVTGEHEENTDSSTSRQNETDTMNDEDEDDS